MVAIPRFYTITAVVVVLFIIGSVATMNYFNELEKDQTVEITVITIPTTQQKEVQESVKIAMERFDEKVEQEIGPADMQNFIEGIEPEVFIIEHVSLQLVSHVDQNLLYTNDYAIAVADEPFTEVTKLLNDGQGVWIHFDEYNPETDKVEKKQAWVQKHYAYYFGSGFFDNSKNNIIGN